MASQDYVLKNREWLKQKLSEPGVTKLTEGVGYKVIKNGGRSTQRPSKNSVVTVHYTGTTINGKKFDSSRGSTPPAFRLRELISGWIIALQNMTPGDRWEVYISADHGYGKRSQPGIPGGSTLVFDIELIAVN